ncbi:hypothetical protein [Olleya sp. Bg11-27]|uniref:hypothetical protein n=1 Tax=Olleya sp. Bg11-27 TaxID=2058135 RepID=UPI000C318B29|nr:hypothetical protein [Olleya sp. Bg11-27]AUC76191.1 hypothetical protein CW732_11155 [Olleya sp. Bg11-27]
MNIIKSPKVLLLTLITTMTMHATVAQDQNMPHTIDALKALDKATLITKAITIIDTNYPELQIEPQDYKITVWSNTKDVLVNFQSLVQFSPLGNDTTFDYNLIVNMLNNNVNNFDLFGTDRFYVPTTEERKTINRVKQLVGFQPDFINEVQETEKTYHLYISNDVYFYSYEIDKITGDKLPNTEVQGNWEPDPDQDNDKPNPDPLLEME